jgi:hypothetical protein
MMRKFAFAALGFVTRVGRSLAAFTVHEKATPSAGRNPRKSLAAHKSARATAASAKQH